MRNVFHDCHLKGGSSKQRKHISTKLTFEREPTHWFLRKGHHLDNLETLLMIPQVTSLSQVVSAKAAEAVGNVPPQPQGPFLTILVTWRWWLWWLISNTGHWQSRHWLGTLLSRKKVWFIKCLLWCDGEDGEDGEAEHNNNDGKLSLYMRPTHYRCSYICLTFISGKYVCLSKSAGKG